MDKEASLMTAQTVRRALGMVAGLLLVLGAATGAWAQIQGLFYAEETKDGRIYVFNVKENWERFKASGETGTGITRLGVGPNGETVYADNETALELYFFKHGIQESVERPKPPVQKVEWRDGKTRFTLGDNFYMEMSNRIQPRFTYEMPDDSITLPGTGGGGDGKGSFRIRRAKFKLEGWFYKPTLEFELQLNWTDVVNTPASQFLEDANLDWDVSKKKAFRVKFGQFKAPYGRQQLTSSGSQQFVDRSIIDGAFNPARETGLSLWGTLGTNKLDWRVMASNGNGRTQVLNDNDKFLYTARVMWQALGNVRMNQWASGALMTEGDLGESAAANGPLLAIAGQFAHDDRHRISTNNDPKNRTYGADYTFKYKGFASVADANWRHVTPEEGAAFDAKGYLGQVSYAWKAPGIAGASFWELAFRYAQRDPSDLVADNDQKEIGGAINYYYNRHIMKVQADFRQLEDEAANSGEGTKNKEFRLQLQFIF
jgi:phosphate-selective porin OprO/OprP